MIRESVDYITLTKKVSMPENARGVMTFGAAQYIAREAFCELLARQPVMETTTQNGFYFAAFVDVLTGMTVNVGEEPSIQGIKFTASGKALRFENQTTAILERALVHGWKATRIDFALDIIDGCYTVSDYASELSATNEGKTKRTLGSIVSANGDTFYVGSRKSARMVRIYDKAAEQGVELNWIRLEAELKDYAAHPSMVKYLTDRRFAYSVVLDILRLKDSPLTKEIESAATGYSYEKVTVPQSKPDRLKWFQNQVTMALGNLFEDDQMAAIEALASLEEIMLDCHEKWLNDEKEGKSPKNWYNRDK